MTKAEKNIKKAQFAELIQKVASREDRAEYFKKYLRIKDRDSSKIIPFAINDSQKKLKAIIDKWDKGTDKRTLFIIILKNPIGSEVTCYFTSIYSSHTITE